MIEDSYKDQVKLLLRILPYFMREKRFALKGGTAINLFYQNMPRLSVDIDLTYLPIEGRKPSFAKIDDAFLGIVEDLKLRFPTLRIQPIKTNEGNIKQIVFREFKAAIKVEINHILRGTVRLPHTQDLCLNAQETFESFVRATCLSREDLYAGKICAALDRQHPRDLFDIRIFLEKNTLDVLLRKCFIIYLISNNRPISELINPNRLDMRSLYENEFQGMSLIPMRYEELVEAREDLIQRLDEGLTDRERKFLISFKSGEPDWDLLEIKNAESFPSIQWKLQNIGKMDRKKHQLAIDELKRKLKL
ncbi:MAG: nucleotidyl transferase AbiEii/AbiGii toxin family protein [Proteobacteria bacterium]|nr:nucleotidyl transferase AbiEii/AbiGii toxin family protein [Pseudomonadota bacterium]